LRRYSQQKGTPTNFNSQSAALASGIPELAGTKPKNYVPHF
jgi:hypothetical protein